MFVKSTLKISILTLLLNVAAGANEIKPFGTFEFGDSFSTVYKKVCEMSGIKTVQFGFRQKKLTKDKFCTNKDFALKYLAKELDFVYKIDGFDNLGYFTANDYTPLRLEAVNVKGVNFKLDLLMFAESTEKTIGSYLLTKNDTFKFGDYFIPMQINTVRLFPMADNEYRTNKKEIYDILRNKYSSLINNIEQSDKYMSLNIVDKNNNKLKLDNSSIIYKSNINEVYFDKYKKYLEEKAKSNTENDQSSSL